MTWRNNFWDQHLSWRFFDVDPESRVLTHGGEFVRMTSFHGTIFSTQHVLKHISRSA